MNTLKRLDDIHMLRGVAIILVLLQHLPHNLVYWPETKFLSIYQHMDGTVGVDLFFVISGFLMCKIYLLDFQKDDSQLLLKNTLTFWSKRIIRLFPASCFWLFAVLLGSVFLNKTNAFQSVTANLEGAVAALLQVANIRLMDCFTHYECGINTVQWSLSLEQQFYFLFPFLVYFAKKRLVLILGIALFSQFFVNSLIVPWGLRFSGFAFGILIGIFANSTYHKLFEPQKFLPLSKYSHSILFFLLIAMFTWVVGEQTHVVPHDLKFNVIAMCCSLIVLIASYDNSWLIPPSYLKSVLLFIGSRSYSYYLCHYFCFALTRAILQPIYPQFSTNITAIFIYLSIAILFCGLLGEMSYRYLEIKAQKIGQRYLEELKQKLRVHSFISNQILSNESGLDSSKNIHNVEKAF